MATLKIRFRPSSVKDKDGTLYYQIIHKRRVKQVYTGLRLRNEEWNGETGTVFIDKRADIARITYLTTVKAKLMNGMGRLNGIVARLILSGKDFTAEEIAYRFIYSDTGAGLISFSQKLIDDLCRIGKRSMARRYRVTLNNVLRFTQGKEVAWDGFNSTFVSGFEEFLRNRGLCRNSTSFYMRNLRSIINRASECDHEVPHHAFKHVYMGIDKTVKRAVSLKTICKIRDVYLENFPHLDFARNVFMFAFYTRGMSFVDMAFLKKSDVSNGVISYYRRKTSQYIQVRLERQTLDIMDKIGKSSTSYLMPLIGSEYNNTENQYRNIYHRINRNLKKLGEMLHLDTKLTLYVARHSWASIAHHNNVPISVISKAMGHDSESTTLIYLNSIDPSAVDKANQRIITLMKDSYED